MIYKEGNLFINTAQLKMAQFNQSLPTWKNFTSWDMRPVESKVVFFKIIKNLLAHDLHQGETLNKDQRVC